MSTDEEDVARRSVTPSTSGRSPTNLLRHQASFEARYSSIIQRQIWETTINKDVMQQQLNEYFPFARSASLTRDWETAGSTAEHGSKARSLATTPTRQRSPEQSEQSQSHEDLAAAEGGSRL